MAERNYVYLPAGRILVLEFPAVGRRIGQSRSVSTWLTTNWRLGSTYLACGQQLTRMRVVDPSIFGSPDGEKWCEATDAWWIFQAILNDIEKQRAVSYTDTSSKNASCWSVWLLGKGWEALFSVY